MQSTRSLVIGASLGALINLAATSGAEAKQSASDAQAKETAKQIQALRDQIDALQRKVDAQAASEQQTKAAADAAAAQAAAAKAAAAAVPATVKSEVKTAVDAAKPKTDKIYYKGITITPGGFAALETIYRSHNETADISSSFAVPYANNPVGHTNETRFTARQSRVSLLAQGDVNPTTHLGFYGEFDFQAAAQTANSNQSNSYNPRIRHLYAQIDWDTWGLHFLGGQNWSLVTMNTKGITPRNEAPPPTIDAQYVPGFSWTRQPQLRVTKDFDKKLWLAVSLENPQSTFAGSSPSTVSNVYNSAAGSGFNSANTLSINNIPDVIGKAAYEATVGERTIHTEVFGLYRSFYQRLAGVNDNTSGGGVGAGIMIPVVPKILDFQFSGMVGKGIGRYGTAGLPDVTFDQSGHIRPIKEVQMLAGLTLHAMPTLDVYLFAGQERETRQAWSVTNAAGTVTNYGYGNPNYDNSGCYHEGAAAATCVGNSRYIEQATLGFWHKPYSGPFGKFQYGLQYSFTERKAMAGNGALGTTPVANDNMVFASFRYYPF